VIPLPPVSLMWVDGLAPWRHEGPTISVHPYVSCRGVSVMWMVKSAAGMRVRILDIRTYAYPR
jgi:hypothetical protein